jgi:hypothetical protein
MAARQYRRADNGRYCTERYAKRHPKTTVSEPQPSPGTKKTTRKR